MRVLMQGETLLLRQVVHFYFVEQACRERSVRVNVNSLARRRHLSANASEVISNGITLSWQICEGVCWELEERSLLDVD